MLFSKKILIWKTYITNKALSTTKQVQMVDLKELIIVAFNINGETFVVHVAIREQEKMLVYSKKQAQVRVLLFDEAFPEVPAEYSNYSNVFSAESVTELLENIGMNKYAIKLEKDKQLPFSPIYNLGPIELKILKTYIETNLANSLIRPSKSPARKPIFFDMKPDRSLRFCINY